MNHMYHQEGKTDLQKMRDVALHRATGDKYAKPEATTIHHHAKRNGIYGPEIACAGHYHEVFDLGGKNASGA